MLESPNREHRGDTTPAPHPRLTKEAPGDTEAQQSEGLHDPPAEGTPERIAPRFFQECPPSTPASHPRLTKEDRGWVDINPDECKGCGLCVENCIPKVLQLGSHLNRFGYHPAEYLGHGCNGCGICFYTCPEPGALIVYKRASAA